MDKDYRQEIFENFGTDDQVLIPLEKLYRQYTGDSLSIKLAEFIETSESIQFLVDEIQKITGIKDFGKYLTAMLEIDAFFLNEDRHTSR